MVSFRVGTASLLIINQNSFIHSANLVIVTVLMETVMSKFDQLLQNNAEIDGVKTEGDLPSYNDGLAWNTLEATCGLSGNEFRAIRSPIDSSIIQSQQGK